MTFFIDKKKWTRVLFGDVVANVNETTRDPVSDGIAHFVGLDHLQSGEIRVNRFGNTADGVTFTKIVSPGQTLFGKRRAYQRKVAFADFKAVCSGDILTFAPKSDSMLAGYLPFLVMSEGFFKKALSTSAGSLSPRTRWSDLAEYEFLLPPIDQQAEISELFWTLNDHKERLESNIAHLKLNISKLIEIELENISYNSGETKLANLGLVNPSVSKVDTESPFIEMADVEEWGYWAKSSSSKGTRGGIKAKGGDILLARITPCLENGKLARVPFHFDQVGGSTEFLVLRAMQDEYQDYLMMLISLPSFHSSLVHAMVGSTGRQRLSADTLRNLVIPNSTTEDMDRLTKVWTESRIAIDALMVETTNIKGLISQISKEVFSGDDKHDL
jgi:type I restriction enzyme S subunit